MRSHRFALILLCVLATIVVAPESLGQSVPPLLSETVDADTRAVRRDVPLTRMIRRAMEAGTRDFTGRPGENYWQLEVDYDIDVRIIPSTQRLVGRETVTIHNNAPAALTEIYLRLDHNIFRDDVPRGSSVPAQETEGMVITRLSVDGREVDLFQPPPEPNRWNPQPIMVLGVSGLEETVARISLDEPVAAGADAVLEIEWHTVLPGGPNGQGHRMTQRWDDRVFQPTQWFPRVAKYDDLRGWWTDVYLGPAEFYNNFGRYDVRIHMPEGWLVSGTGVLQNPEQVLTESARERLEGILTSDDEHMIVGEGDARTADGDRLTWHFVADYVNDFAWATSDEFVWRATRAVIPEHGPIPVHMLYLPERSNLFEEAGSRTRHALEFYSELWAPYPFPQLTLQDGPSSGMEYPMVINSNQGAADHETAHQWWPMMLGTNETWYGWMDEGFNSYMNILSRADASDTEANLDGLGLYYGMLSGDETEPTMMWQANFGGDQYRFQTYRKAPLMLSMLGGIVGDAKVQRAMSAYTDAWAFRHPSPWDFAFFMSNELGVDLGWFWHYWLWTTDAVHGSIESVDAAAGVVRVRQDGQMPAPIVLRVDYAGGTSVMVDWPVDVWFDGARVFEAAVPTDAEIEQITLDPGCRFPDADPSNNVWRADGAAELPACAMPPVGRR